MTEGELLHFLHVETNTEIPSLAITGKTKNTSDALSSNANYKILCGKPFPADETKTEA